MTQSKDSGPDKAPGFGAFIGSPTNDNSTAETRERKPRRSTKATKSRARKTTRRSKSAEGEGPEPSSEMGAGDAEAGSTRTRRKRASRGRGRSDQNKDKAPEERGDESEAPRRRSRSRRGASHDDSQATTETQAASTESESGESRSRSRRSASSRRRGRSSSDEGREEASSDRADRTEGSEETREERAPRRKRSSRGGRGRSRKKATGSAESAEEAAVEADDQDTSDAGRAQGDEGHSESEGEGRGRRRKRTVSRKRRPATKRTAGEEEDGESTDAQAEAEDTETEKPKRRRRGTRGGRNRKRKSSSLEEPAAAVLEDIPGEEDDLPELPDLPDEAELIKPGDMDEPSRGRGRKKRGRRGSSEEADEEGAAKKPARRTSKKAEVVPDRKILVNAHDNEEMRVAVVRDGKILDFQMTVDSDTTLVNDIYRGRIVNIEASIGAAFVDFGRGRNGFLHTSDVLPTYADRDVSLRQLLSTCIDPEDWDSSSSQPSVADELSGDDEDGAESDDGEEGDEASEQSGSKKKKMSSRKKRGGRAGSKGERGGGKGDRGKARQQRFRSRPRRPISELFKVGQKVVVQITKDAIGDKGPTLTTYLSIPGRYLVLMPSISHRGVSRKIEDSKERKRLKRILDGLKVPEGMGIIARTATMGRTKIEITRDLDYLLSAWNRLAKRLDQGHGPTALYQESDVAIRTVRDLFGPETESVIVDDHESYQNIREFAEQLMPEQIDRIVEHEGARPLFHDAGVEQDFEKIFSRRIELPSGGSIVFDQAEALVAIDVNSGKTRTSSHDFEEIALKTNMEAVPEIARQIRLRDLGGIIVVDFIDMMKNSNRKAVEQSFRSCFSEDRARSKVGRISQFGLLEMTRQRLGPGISKKLFRPCTSCRGLGRTRTEASRAAAILRRLGSAMTLKGFTTVEVKAHPETIQYLKKERRDELNRMEQESGRKLELKAVPDQVEDSVLRYLRTDGREVRPGGRRKR